MQKAAEIEGSVCNHCKKRGFCNRELRVCGWRKAADYASSLRSSSRSSKRPSGADSKRLDAYSQQLIDAIQVNHACDSNPEIAEIG